MSFKNSDLDKVIKRLEADMVTGEQRNIRQSYQYLKTQILTNGLDEIGCLNLLTRAYTLMKQFKGEGKTEAFEKLEQHLVVIEDVHKKFFSVLYETNYEILFYEELSNWVSLPKALEVDFSSLDLVLDEAIKESNLYSLLEKFFDAFLPILESYLDQVDFQTLKKLIQLSLAGYRYNEKWDVYGLFALSEGAATYGIKVNVTPGSGQIKLINSTEDSIQTSANRAVASIKNIVPSAEQYDYAIELEREDIKYSGNSIELPFCIAIAKKIKGISIDPYTAFTGCVDMTSGKIGSVSKTPEKVHAASISGMKRVFVPDENKDEITSTPLNLDIRPVSNISEVLKGFENRSILGLVRNQSDLFQAKIKRLEILLREDNIHYLPDKDKPVQGGIQLWFTDYATNVNINLYERNLKCVVGGSTSPLKGRIEAICEQVFGEKESKTSGKFETLSLKISDASKQKLIQDYFSKSDDVTMEEEKNCLFRAKITRNGTVAYVRQYNSGTLTIFGPEDIRIELFSKVQNILGVSLEATTPDNKMQAQVAAVKSIELGNEWIGTDESGKGDYYGPLVGAAVLVDRKTAPILEDFGIKDSKKIADKRIHELAQKIKQVCGEKAQVIPISPEKYNALYGQFTKEGKNLNTLLAWAHTRGIENIIERFGVEEITVIVDKFADESYIQSKLLESGRKANLNIVQLPKAEANIAVAAASVLARSEFLKRLGRLSEKYNQKFPKGASDPNVVVIGKSIVQNFGEEELKMVAKLHFKTTKKIL